MILNYLLLSLTAIFFIAFWTGIIIKKRRIWIASLIAFLVLIFVDIALMTMKTETGSVTKTEFKSQ
ncbi:hypothetical protein [Saccharicrinis sp. FJH54]|uniref:hypothetical protein n=1 Tax=Saccharicrinis sp. FJH54 TaxID=3344665 RepID=UPI0035D440B1